MAGQGSISGKMLAVAFGGGVLLWSGIQGKQVSGALRDILAGKNPASAPGTPVTSPLEASELTGSATTNLATGTTGNTGASSASAAKNQAIGRLLAAPYGWSTGTQWTALVEMWNEESGWSNTVTNDNQPYNPTTVAYGIPQALPASKMGTLANPPYNSAAAQIAWGLSYIKSRYGSPAAAWQFHLANGFY